MFFVTKRFSESLSFNPFSSITILNFWAYVYLIKYLIYVHCPSLPPNPPQHPLCNVLHILHHQLLRPQYPTVDPPLRMKIEHHSIRQPPLLTRPDDLPGTVKMIPLRQRLLPLRTSVDASIGWPIPHVRLVTIPPPARIGEKNSGRTSAQGN